MQKFAALFEQIDQTQSTNEKVDYIKEYFLTCSDADGAWTLFFLSGKRLKRLISSRLLLQWCCKLHPLPNWLIEECYAAVGDTAETISLLLPRKNVGIENLHTLSEWMEVLIKPLQNLTTEQQEEKILYFWNTLSTKEIFILNKILTGSFRMGVSLLLTLKGLSQAVNISREVLSQRLMGKWEPTPEFFANLKSNENDIRYLNPFPFYLAYPLEAELDTLGNPEDWIAEWKWDGIRAQAVIHEEKVALWSRGNELISHQFPELLDILQAVPSGTIIDGEIVAYADDRPLPFADLQKRLGRKAITKTLIEKMPIAYIVYDILEHNGEDIRTLPLNERRQIIATLNLPSKILVSEELKFSQWQELLDLRTLSREKATEGIMLKKRDSIYGVGRKKGFWWKFKVDAMTLDAVLMYAQAGTGRRASLFTDYTFGVWKDNELIPIGKAYSGLDQKEINELDNWIRRNTEEKFGPVRKVKAFQVFEIAFEGIQLSKRHKSGVALRFPRIARWRKDKPFEECDSLEMILETFFHEKQ